MAVTFRHPTGNFSQYGAISAAQPPTRIAISGPRCSNLVMAWPNGAVTRRHRAETKPCSRNGRGYAHTSTRVLTRAVTAQPHHWTLFRLETVLEVSRTWQSLAVTRRWTGVRRRWAVSLGRSGKTPGRIWPAWSREASRAQAHSHADMKQDTLSDGHVARTSAHRRPQDLRWQKLRNERHATKH